MLYTYRVFSDQTNLHRFCLIWSDLRHKYILQLTGAVLNTKYPTVLMVVSFLILPQGRCEEKDGSAEALPSFSYPCPPTRTRTLHVQYPFWIFCFLTSQNISKQLRVSQRFSCEKLLWWASCLTLFVVRPPGLEPGTQGLKVLCSTN